MWLFGVTAAMCMQREDLEAWQCGRPVRRGAAPEPEAESDDMLYGGSLHLAHLAQLGDSGRLPTRYGSAFDDDDDDGEEVIALNSPLLLHL